MAELADAAGLGPVGPRGPWRFESSRPHRLRARTVLLLEATQPEQPDVVPGLAVEREVGEDLADDGAELEPVTGEPGADDGELGVRVAVDEEVLVRRRLEQARLQRDRRSGSLREVALGEAAPGGAYPVRRRGRGGTGRRDGFRSRWAARPLEVRVLPPASAERPGSAAAGPGRAKPLKRGRVAAADRCGRPSRVSGNRGVTDERNTSGSSAAARRFRSLLARGGNPLGGVPP